MSTKSFKLGDMVTLSAKGWEGMSGIVSRPIVEGSVGHVLVHRDGHVLGVDASADEVSLVGERSEGFTQLAYNLIKLGSHVIERFLT
jgi:hypothetical protein